VKNKFLNIGLLYFSFGMITMFFLNLLHTSTFLLIIMLYCDWLLIRLYRERITQVDTKLGEVRCGRAQEYLQPLEELQENMRIRTEVAGVLREFRLTNIRNKFEAEELAASQNYEVFILETSQYIVVWTTWKLESMSKFGHFQLDLVFHVVPWNIWSKQQAGMIAVSWAHSLPWRWKQYAPL
jgi:hypothetical protein